MSRQLSKNAVPQISRFIYTSIVVILTGIAFSSCKTTKNVNSYYFKNLPRDTSFNSAAKRSVETKIRKTDLLSIGISSLNREEDAVYNAPAAGSTTSSTSSAPTSGYLVDMNGNIQLHKLGVVHVEGMTRRELKDKIQKDLQPYLKDAVITIRYLNHRVTVLGEVNKSQVIQMPEEQMSLFEVLGNSGDVTQFARRDNILIIRETPTGKQLKRINLENQSVFTSEWYYMQPDDVVYVEPNDKKLTEENRSKRQQTISLALSGLSVALIILNRIFP